MYAKVFVVAAAMFQCSCEAPGMRSGRRQRGGSAESLFATSSAFTPRGHGDDQVNKCDNYLTYSHWQHQ